jgi:hypothetical protein
MKTTRNLSIRKALLSTIAVAGLVAGTAACGGKNTDTSASADKQALIEALLDAARTGTEAEIANIIEAADPNLVAQVLPEIDAELDAPNVVAPETAVDAPAAPADEVVAAEESAPEVSTPEVSTPEVATPEVEAEEEAADDVTPEVEEEAGPDIDEETAPDLDFGDFPDIDLDGFDPDFDFELPELSVPDLGSMIITAPNIEFASFWTQGRFTDVWVTVNEGSAHVMSNITSVKVSYRVGVLQVTKNAVFDAELDNNIFRWEANATNITDGTKVTITVTNAFGMTDTFTVTASVSSPL